MPGTEWRFRSLLGERPRILCRQLVVANHVLSTKIYSIGHTETRDDSVRSRWQSLHDVLASIFCHRTFCFCVGQGEERKGPTSFKACAVAGMVGLALNFKMCVCVGGVSWLQRGGGGASL